MNYCTLGDSDLATPAIPLAAITGPSRPGQVGGSHAAPGRHTSPELFLRAAALLVEVG